MLAFVLAQLIVKAQHVPDNAFEACQICTAEFTFFNRRHHCRSVGFFAKFSESFRYSSNATCSHCGRLLCGDCTSRTAALPPAFGSPGDARVCFQCFPIVQQNRKAAPLPMPATQRNEKDFDEVTELRKRLVAFSLERAQETTQKLWSK